MKKPKTIKQMKEVFEKFMVYVEAQGNEDVKMVVESFNDFFR